MEQSSCSVQAEASEEEEQQQKAENMSSDCGIKRWIILLLLGSSAVRTKAL